MVGSPLDVDYRVGGTREDPTHRHDGGLGGIGPSMELRLSGKERPDGDAVEAADKVSGLENLHAVRPAHLMQSAIRATDV